MIFIAKGLFYKHLWFSWHSGLLLQASPNLSPVTPGSSINTWCPGTFDPACVPSPLTSCTGTGLTWKAGLSASSPHQLLAVTVTVPWCPLPPSTWCSLMWTVRVWMRRAKKETCLDDFYQLPCLPCSLTTYTYTCTHTLTPLLRVRNIGWGSSYRGDNILGPYITNIFPKHHKEDSLSLWETPNHMTRRNTESQIWGKPERSLISMGPK